EDANGATVGASAASIGLAVVAGTGTSGATLTCAFNRVTASSGVADFSSCAIDHIGSGYELVATDSTDRLISAPSSPFSISAGTPSALVFSTEPSGGSGGAAFSMQPVVTVVDAGGNTVGGSSDQITLAIAGGGAAGAGLTCTTNPLGATAGVATFAGCAIDAAGSAYTLSATDSTANVSGTSTAFDVVAGTAGRISFSTQPGGGAGGSPFGTQPAVTLTDAGGNPVSGSVALTLSGGTAGAALSCAVNPFSASSGVATFSGCSVSLNGNGYRITATSGSLTAVSQPFSVTGGNVARAAFTNEPTSSTGGTSLPSQPAVALTDAGGNPAAGAVTLTITPGTGQAGANLTCASNTVTAVGGTATFGNCSVDRAGTGYTLTATTGSVTATSTAFDVGVGPIAQIAFTTQPGGGTGGVAWPAQPIVAIEDAGGNQEPAASGSVALSITAGTGSGALTCAANALPAVRGAALFDGCRIDRTALAYTLTARDTADGLTTTSAPFAITAGAAAQLLFTTQPGGAGSGVAFPTQPVVAVADAGGNTVTGSGASIGLALTPGTGTSGAGLSCASNPLGASGGTAAFSACSVNRAASGYTLTATDASDRLAVESLPFAVLAPPPGPLGQAPTGVPAAQTMGGRAYAVNPTATTDDVNSATGALTFSATDLRVAGIGEPFLLQRTYNSNDTTGGSFGPGWSSILDVSVKVVPGQTETVRGEDGQQLVWTWNPTTSSWTPPPGAQATLVCAAKKCSLTRFDNVRWDVNLTATGSQVADYLAPDLQGLTFAWSAGKVVVTVATTNATPYNVTLTLNAAGEVTGASTPKNRRLAYGYTNGLLTSVQDARGNSWTYGYSSGRLTTETDPLGHVRLTATYDPTGRVSAVSAKGGPLHTDDTFTWDPGTQTSTRMALDNAGGALVREPYVEHYVNNVLVSQSNPAGGVV
ncbi:MAG TPA: RHS repeat domain-containing protein, partial [Candidatus Dormibacteraeota bacterium]|nr:RHS repeat domain-containing protein [Candidatus Dormibacteraeota bacterium]